MRYRRLLTLILAFLAATSLFSLRSGPSKNSVLTPSHYYQPLALQWRREFRRRNWCKNGIKMKENSENLVALASFPGSGNTWLRYLLQQATGLATGSVYEDLALMHNGFVAENVANASVLVVKTHEMPRAFRNNRFKGSSRVGGSKSDDSGESTKRIGQKSDNDNGRRDDGRIKNSGQNSEISDEVTRKSDEIKPQNGISDKTPSFDKAILLIRRPLEAIEAEFHRRAAGHLGHADRSKFVQDGGRFWRDFVSTHLESWQMFNKAWLKLNPSRLKVVCYERLKSKTLSELINILGFIEVFDKVSKEDLRCTINRKQGWFRRKKVKFDFQLFNEVMKRKGYEAEMSLNRLLSKHGVNFNDCFNH